MKRTPVFAEITDLIKGPIDIYEDPLEFTTTTATNLNDFLTELDTKTLVLAPRYYIEIKAPDTYNSVAALPQVPDSRIPIQKFLIGGNYRYFIRYMITPSVGWGINSSYNISYKYWIPIVKGVNQIKASLSKKGTLKDESWLVPHSNGYHSLNYKEWNDYDRRPPLTKSLELTKTSMDEIPLSSYDMIDILSIVGEDETQYKASIAYGKVNSLMTQSIDEDIYTNMRLVFDGPSPLLNQKYTVTYTKPALLKDIIFIDSNSPRNIYSNSFYPGVFDPKS